MEQFELIFLLTYLTKSSIPEKDAGSWEPHSHTMEPIFLFCRYFGADFSNPPKGALKFEFWSQVPSVLKQVSQL